MAQTVSEQKTLSVVEMLENKAITVTSWTGSIWSLIVHTILFAGAFLLILLGIDMDRVLLVLTTIVSLEAIYLSIFIQMSVNHQAKALANVEKDIDEIAEDMEDIQENVEEMQEDVEGIAKDVDEIAEDVEEIAEDVEELQEDVEEIAEDVEDIAEDVEELQEEEKIQEVRSKE